MTLKFIYKFYFSVFYRYVKMNKENVKQCLQRDKEFLRELYLSDNLYKVKTILNGASDLKLNTLAKFLHFLSNGEIRIKKENFEKIKSSKRLQFLKKNVEAKAALQRLLKSERKSKLKFLIHLQSIYPYLLYCLFNEA